MKKFREKRFKYNVGNIIKTKTGEIEILECIKIYKKNNIDYYKGYNYKCLKDGYIGRISEYHLNDRQGCSVCAKKIVMKGINDIATTNPEMIKYFDNVDDIYNYSFASNKKVLIKCPDCNSKKMVRINSLCRNGFSCSKCGDKISYPNKFIFNMFEQLKIEFECEKVFEWAKDKRYDFYIPSLNYIIEANGLQHYEEPSKNSKFRHTLHDEQENDNIKKQLANKNGINKYITIDCRYSTSEWIKSHIINSELITLFNLNKIDWIKCDEYTKVNLIKSACKYWNEGMKSTVQISEIVKINRFNVIKYLKKGNKLKWCDYDAKEEMRKSAIKNGKVNKKPIICLETHQIFESMAECDRKSEEVFGVKLSLSSISLVCLGRQKSCKNLHFMYYEEYIKQQSLPY